jgi:pimeloyl-ACP methyl ester carboxylesterase
MEPEQRFVDVPTGPGSAPLRLAYVVWRSGTGAPPLVLNHATGFLARLWQPVAERLAERYEVLAYDARGHGDSDKPAPEGDNYHWSRFVDDLKAFMDALDLRDIPFAGHSAGGAAGLYMAAHHPEYFSRLAVIEPIVRPAMFAWEQDGRDQMAEGARKRRQAFASVDEMVEQYRSRSLFERWPRESQRLYAEHGTFKREDGSVQLKCAGEIEAAIFEHSGSLDIWSVLPNVRVPVLVAFSEHTNPMLRMIAEGVAGRVADGRVVTIADAGHLAPMERPDVVADIVAGFLESAEI